MDTQYPQNLVRKQAEMVDEQDEVQESAAATGGGDCSQSVDAQASLSAFMQQVYHEAAA